MTRSAVRAALAAPGWALIWALALAPPARAIDPHMDLGRLPAGCDACHRGHGASRSPMLPGPQAEVCLSCHDSRAKADRRVAEEALAPGEQPRLLAAALSLPFTHPLSAEAFSRHEPGAVTCSSCHSPHRGMAESDRGSARPDGRRRLSTRDPNRFEFELCQGCHGTAGLGTQSPLDLSRLTNPNNRSYHPIEAPAVERAPSTLPAMAGRDVNCTDCHGNSDPDGARGPHGSDVLFILRRPYETADGAAEGEAAYALCYECHDRESLLDGSPFPYHRLHVVDQSTSCATCHSAHGSIDNRALIRFGEETFLAGVAPSVTAGRLAFDSTGPGSGACWLTCHGVDHAPLGYGSGALDAALPFAESFGEAAPSPDRPAAPPATKRRPERSPPPR